MSPRPLERGFTLVECLAVVALVALAMSVGAVGVASSSAEARMRGARSAILDLDARARSLARGGGGGGGSGATFLWIDERRAVVERGGELLLERDLPHSVDAAMIDPSSRRPMPAVRFDADGTGPDYLIALRATDAANETLVAGLTGYAFESREVGR